MSAVSTGYVPIVEPIFNKGTSRRIFGELYKVIDSSDVIIHVLDARDPLGTLCTSVIDFVRKEKSHKQVVYLINKVDLVPGWVTVSFPHTSILLRAFPFFWGSPLPSQMHVFTRGHASLRRWDNITFWGALRPAFICSFPSTSFWS